MSTFSSINFFWDLSPLLLTDNHRGGSLSPCWTIESWKWWAMGPKKCGPWASWIQGPKKLLKTATLVLFLGWYYQFDTVTFLFISFVKHIKGNFSNSTRYSSCAKTALQRSQWKRQRFRNNSILLKQLKLSVWHTSIYYLTPSGPFFAQPDSTKCWQPRQIGTWKLLTDCETFTIVHTSPSKAILSKTFKMQKHHWSIRRIICSKEGLLCLRMNQSEFTIRGNFY